MRFLPLILCLLSSGGTAWTQAYNWKPVVINGGGYVDGIVFHPNAPGLMYCRTDIGGAYRWNAPNNSWTQLLNFVGYPNNQGSLMGTESIGLDLHDTNRLYLACGWLGAGSPSGIMISTNQGASFTVINSPFVIESNNDGRGSGERFGVDPNLGSILFYGTHLAGLWKSVNHAANWSQVTNFPISTTANGVGIVFVEFIQSSGSPGSATPVIWVGVSQGGTNLFRSTDGGSTWIGIHTNGVSSGYMPHHASQDGLGNVYITFCDGPGPNGVSYGAVRKFNLTTLASIDVTPPTGQGGFGGVTVDRQNPNTVAVSTIDCWWPQNYIYRSTNGGTNWTQTYAGNTDCSSAPWMGVGASGPVVQGWSDDLKIDPFNSNHLFFTSGGGVFSSFNFTAAQPLWQFRSDGIEEMVFCTVGSDLASPPGGGPQLLTVFGDIGGFAHYNLDVSPPATNYFNPGGGNNYGIDFAERNPNLVVRTYYTSGRSGYFSTNSGRTWTQFATEPAAAATNGPGVVVISADGRRLVWAIPGSPSFYSTNNGTTWTQSAGSNPTPPYSWEQPYPFSDRMNPNKFYIYMPDSGVVYISTNGGASFFAGAKLAAWADSMHTTFGQEGNVWLASYNGLWCSTNSAASFFQVPGVQAAHTVGFGKSKSSGGYPAIYLHGEINNTWGVYRSDDLAATWTRIDDDQHQYGGIAQVLGDPEIYGRCYIAALGIVYGDLPNQPPFTPTGLTATASNAAVSLTWGSASGADSYVIDRSTVSGGPYTNIASGVTATSYLDTGLFNGTTYYYVVAATNAYGVSADSAEASATPLVEFTGTVIGSPGSWDNVGNTITNVFDGSTNTFYDAADASGDWAGLDLGSGAAAIVTQINYCPRVNSGSRMDGGLFQGANVANFSSGVVTLFTISNSPPNGWTTVQNVTNAGPFRYLRYIGPANGWCNVAEVQFWGYNAVAPAAPTGLSAVAGDAQVTLSWNASSGATSYYVKRSITSGNGYTAMATNASITLTNTGLTNGTLYYFVVSAVNAYGEGSNSAQVSVRPTSSAPGQLGFAAAGNQLQLDWPADHLGWQLQAQADDLAGGLGTNWVEVSGSDQTNQTMLPLNPTNGAVFFRLKRP